MGMRLHSHLYLRFSEHIDPDLNSRIHVGVRQLLQASEPGILDVIPGYNTLLVEFDPRATSPRRLRALMNGSDISATNDTGGRRVNIPVVYEGPDLKQLAGDLSMQPSELVTRHAGRDYVVYAIGFTPGFPFLGDVDPAIRTPRLNHPRAVVPAGSVGIADHQTGIYPVASPGGWRILGKTTERVYDPHRGRPFLLEPGDKVRFIPVETDVEPTQPSPLCLLPESPAIPAFRVHKPGLLDLILDQGRQLVGRYGLARSGPLDPLSAKIATGLVANRPNDPLMEINVIGPTLEALRDVIVGFAGAGVVPHIDGRPVEPYRSLLVKRGQLLTFPPGPAGRRGYLAISGGVDSGRFLESASVDARGLIGRALMADDIIGIADPRTPLSGFSFEPYRQSATVVVLRILPGPQYDVSLMSALCERPLRIEHSDRMGVRLSSIPAQGNGVTSEGNPLGAVQLTRDGHPIILLNDRGTMGGYMKPAIVDPRDLSKLAQARDGDWVVFIAEKG